MNTWAPQHVYPSGCRNLVLQPPVTASGETAIFLQVVAERASGWGFCWCEAQSKPGSSPFKPTSSVKFYFESFSFVFLSLSSLLSPLLHAPAPVLSPMNPYLYLFHLVPHATKLLPLFHYLLHISLSQSSILWATIVLMSEGHLQWLSMA